MNQQTIRPYEMSLWTLQDSFITVLKPLSNTFQGQVITPKISLKNDGTQTLTFSIPMYYRNEVGELVENPLWYDTINGTLLVNLRKIKVIFNKGEEGEGVYEFVIHKITESHSNGQLVCEVEAEGLAFQELGKIGYKITLNYDEFVIDLEKNSSLLASLNYWADKIFKNTNWTYSIQMDWSSYDGVIDLDDDGKIIDYENLTQEGKNNLNSKRESTPNYLRRRDKIYEDDYVSSWTMEDNKLVPREMIRFQEKARIPQIEKSNIYNATQDLAELFKVYCKYKYYYDDNYHIIGRECIFYNNFLDENIGKFDINYPYQSNDIKRTLESVDVVTKMYVEQIDDISIIDSLANSSGEDYILNFDYLYGIGTITEEQYKGVNEFTYQIHKLNEEHKDTSEEISLIDLELVELKAKYKTLTNSITYALEQISGADDFITSLTNGSGVLEKTALAPEKVMILQGESYGATIYKVNLTLEGINPGTVKLYTSYDVENGGVQGSPLPLFDTNFVFDTTTNKNLIGLTRLPVQKSGFAYLVCQYTPSTKYENIKEVYSSRLQQDQNELREIESRFAEIGIIYSNEEFTFINNGYYKQLENSLIAKQEQMATARANFEKMMGPALREGSWTPDSDYLEPGDKYSDFFTFEYHKDLLYAYWDTELFDEELNNYYEEGIDLNKVYYPAIDLRKIYDDTFRKYESDLVLRIQIPYTSGTGSDDTYLKIGSQLQYAFLSGPTGIIPVLLITEPLTPQQQAYLNSSSLGTTQVNNSGEIIFTQIIPLNGTFLNNNSDYSTAYPRIEIHSDKLKIGEDELSVFQNETELIKYNQYTLLYRDGYYCITVKPFMFINQGVITEGAFDYSKNTYRIDYIISNASLHLYLDALEVAKTNAYPLASYEVSVNALENNFVKYAYQKLNKVARINDEELKFENVQGYISEVELDLNSPWKDSFTIQNYKTKFEDLFSRIVASAEEMRTNKYGYDNAASAFAANGVLNASALQNSLNSVNLNYSFNQGDLTIDELNGIWATSSNGVVAMRGGGIFCASERDSNGNWVWNSGITPYGINASVLQAGTINTNLIRICSGDNTRFQMNGEGLFAYASNTDGSTNFNKYVVHNDEGLFLTEIIKPETDNEPEESVDLVEISWNGLVLRNRDNEPVLEADEDGNLAIKGYFTASQGADIAGWKIEKNALTSMYTDPVTGGFFSAGLSSNSDISMPVIWAGRQEKDGEGRDENIKISPFRVMSDGTLYASNAFISGTISANTIIGDLNGQDKSLGSAIKKLDIVTLTGDSFKYSNLNLDGNITIDPDWLRFQIHQENIKLENWKFERWDGETFETNEDGTPKQNEQGESIPIWEEIKDVPTVPTPGYNLYFEDFNYLTFIVKYGIMFFGKEGSEKMHDFVYFRVSGTQDEAKLDSNGEPTGEIETKTYSTTFFLRNKYIATDKELSQFNPPSHTFIVSQNLPDPEPKVFKLTAKNLDLNEGILTVDGERADSATLLSGISEVTDSEVTREDSSLILVPAENLENGKWFINGIEIKNGDKIEGTEKSYLTGIEYDEESGISTISIVIPPEAVEEGGNIIIRYQLGNASRTAFAYKVRNGADNIVIQIASSEGTVFKNGNIKTKLTANLYEGKNLLNTEGTTYGYLWKIRESGKEETVLQDGVLGQKYLNQREIVIEDNDFEDKAIFTCEIYSTEEEATTIYNKYIEAMG